MLDNEAASRTIPIRLGRAWPRAAWRPALLHAAPICLFVLGIFYYWYAVADRYAIFLYNHMGATPFDSFTRGRYWMTGLVAAGAVLVLYTAVNWFVARIHGVWYRGYSPPAWWQVWLLCAVPLGAGIPAITMSRQPAHASPRRRRRLCSGRVDRPRPRPGARPAGCPATRRAGMAGAGRDGTRSGPLVAAGAGITWPRPGKRYDRLVARGSGRCRGRDLVRTGQRVAGLAPAADGTGAALPEWAGPDLSAAAAGAPLAAHAAPFPVHQRLFELFCVSSCHSAPGALCGRDPGLRGSAVSA